MLSDDMKQRIVSFQTRCQDLVVKFNGRMNRDTNVTIHQIQNAARLEKALDWLKAPDPSQNYNNARESHREGTCLWFLTGKEFSEWKESTGSLLWVYGIRIYSSLHLHGSASIVYSSSAIKDITIHCAANPSCAIAYFFFDSRDAQDGLQRHGGLVRCLIKQLAIQCNGMSPAIEKLLGAGNMQPSLESLHIALELLLVKFEHAYLIVDSLDESIERWKVLDWLKEITRREAFKHRTHLLITSRDEIDIRESIESLSVVKVCMEGQVIDDDIRMYLDWTLRTSFHMKRWEHARKREIQQKVSAMSQGMFRLAALQLEELRNCHSIRELETQLGNLPRNLDDTYNRILSKLDEAPLRTAWKLLQWLAFSARLLRLKELAEVVGVDLETKPYPKFRADSRYSDPQSVLIICANLISVSVEGNVQLAHFSVKEFLLSISHRFGFTINSQSSHSLIAQTCLAYLLQFDTPEILKEDTLDNFPLAQYAAEHWISHAKFGTSDSNSDPLQALIYAFFTADNDAPFISWVRLYDLDEPWSEHDFEREPHGSRLYYACLACFQDISMALLEAGGDPNTKGGNRLRLSVLQVASRSGQYRTVQNLLAKGAEVNGESWNGSALNLASARGHGEIVRLLLENEADMNMRSGEGQNSALQVASLAGHEVTVRLLLKKGADVNLLGGLFNSALHAASMEGHDRVVRILLENGAEVDMPGKMGVTALHEASENGFLNVVKLLLEKGADANKRGGHYGTALQAASVGGYEDIVQILLDNGADVGIQGGGCGSSLQAAASGGNGSIMRVLLKNASIPGNVLKSWDRNAVEATLRGGHLKIVKLLLQNGAQVNVPLGGQHGSALGAASFEGHEETVRLLLEKGAEVNIENDKYGTPLRAAALGGHAEIISLLLEKGAEVNTPKEPHGSALQAAASKGHERVVRLLLEKGAEVDKESKEYGTALQAASMSGHELVVKLLIEKGAEVNKRSKRFGDALQMASRRGHEHIVRLLLHHGADVHVRGVGLYGSALQAASIRKHQAIVELLLEKGAVGPDDDAAGAH
ncbi:hypothetical protein HETIRDRAFT_471894 [Heterobasidion irregulare TC 32-1]|uniref:Uncharacterized protein n=1 Tax=Heterobasidion irregulare (strain TC 32-1) TaxID=747525 RepID=W4KCX7_HETIT|nr:uncharacterized protein HETIRDRAFT_471894 [Heterobasidion irregulare TC 32-1]ETW83638.1 hypothetical protein HETIRDRAFT_471894 [Heterobasidion irregulare TC 32-1]